VVVVADETTRTVADRYGCIDSGAEAVPEIVFRVLERAAVFGAVEHWKWILHYTQTDVRVGDYSKNDDGGGDV